MKIELTKTRLLKEVCNDMCHNWYFGCYGRIFSPDQKHYKQCSFVLVVDSEDISDYFDGKEVVTQKNVREYVKFVALEKMVTIDWEFKIQKCPNCGENIMPCSICTGQFSGCFSCPLVTK